MFDEPPSSYIASDYAGICGGEFEFYYGYESVRDDEWLFVVKRGGEVIAQYTAKELGKDQGDNVEDVLLAGIARFFSTWVYYVVPRNEKGLPE